MDSKKLELNEENTRRVYAESRELLARAEKEKKGLMIYVVEDSERFSSRVVMSDFGRLLVVHQILSELGEKHELASYIANATGALLLIAGEEEEESSDVRN